MGKISEKMKEFKTIGDDCLDDLKHARELLGLSSRSAPTSNDKLVMSKFLSKK